MSREEDLAAQRLAHERLLAEFEAQPAVELVGLFSAGSGGAVKLAWSEEWSLHAHFIAWRVRGGSLRRDPVAVRYFCDREELDRIGKYIWPDQIAGMQVKLLDSRQPPEALLIRTRNGVSDDEELNEIRRELLKPISVQDPVLGLVEFDRTLEWYQATVHWCGTKIELHINAKPAELAGCIAFAHELLRDEAEWHERALARIVADLLSLKNESWLGEDESPVTAEEFRQRLQIESLGISPEGEVDFWFRDGDLFWGHAVGVSANREGEFEEAGIHG